MTRGRLFLLVMICAVPLSASAFGRLSQGIFLQNKAPRPAPTLHAKPETNSKEQPAVFTAEQLDYDQKEAVVVAHGKVEVAQGDTVIFADKITYYQNRDVVIAEGNVSMLQPSGDVFFSDRAEMKSAMKTGIIDAFKARMADDSVFVASRAVKESAAVTKLTDASYTPCTICETVAPFWQLNANDVTVDEKAERVVYHDATVAFGGVPVLYTPYLSHPTPDAEAKSGFRLPQYSSSENLGNLVRVPYYWRISHDRDMLITPWLSSQEGLLLQSGYRQLTDNGSYAVDSTASLPERRDTNGNNIGGQEFRGHVFAHGAEQVSDIAHVGFDVERASDDTFLRRYSLDDKPTLFSRLYYEAAEGRNYALAQGLAIQGMRATDDSKTTPYVLPALMGYYESQPDARGLRYHVAGDLQALGRRDGVNQQRVSFTTGASLPYVSDGGHVFTGTLDLRQDFYRTSNMPIGGIPSTDTQNHYRAMPQIALEWRYPLIEQTAHGSWTIEPLALGVLQGGGGNPAGISNEDSHLLELTDTNLFSRNRMPGLDVVDSGPRLAYGGRSQYLFNDGTSFEGLIGQSFNPNADTPFPNSTKPNEDFSDYIGRVAYNIAPYNFAYRFALDNKTLKTNRNEVEFSYSRPWLNFSTSYRSIDNNQFLTSSEEGQVHAQLPLTDRWSIFGDARRNFTIDQFVSIGGGIGYKNECFATTLDMQRSYSRDRDVEPGTAYMLHFALKNLGEFGYGGSVSGAQ